MDNATQSDILQLQEAMKQNKLVVFVDARASVVSSRGGLYGNDPCAEQ